MTGYRMTEGAARRPLGRRFRLAAAVAAAAAAAALFGGLVAGGPGASVAPAPAAAPSAGRDALGRLLDGLSTGDTAGFVRRLEYQVETAPADAESLLLLGLAYQQRARETADPTYFARSQRALVRAGRLAPQETLVPTGLASLAVSRHRFLDALRLARRALQLDPANASAHGALGDALLNLGRYEEAFAAYDRMAGLASGIASYARIAHSRALLGKPRAAIDALGLALEGDRELPEHLAWTLVQLGNLYFDTGRLRPAERAYRAALARYPGYVHGEAALARVAAARGRYRRAAELYRRTVDTLPLPQYAIALGDVLAADGRKGEARRAYALLDVIQRLFRANGVRTETETALFDLDHDRRLADALIRAREAARKWPSIYTQDVLAWALYKNGRCGEARGASHRALRLGTRDALKIFHRGMIELCLGERAEGRAFLRRALEINPYFSVLYAPVAREELR